jgi:hypothetical protein
MLTAVCKLCGENATYSFRTSTATGIEVIGGENEYMPLCRECYTEQSVIQQEQRDFLKALNKESTEDQTTADQKSTESIKQGEGELEGKQSKNCISSSVSKGSDSTNENDDSMN